MTAKGCFSYKNATVNGFNITNQLQVRVEAIDNNVAKIYTTDENGNPLPMPVNVSLRTGEDVNVPVYNNEFLIVWIESYVLAVGGVDILWLHNQKQQAFSASNGITAFSLSAAVKSAYDSAVSASNQTYGIGALDSNGDILLRGNLRISETANIYKGYTHAMYMTSNGIVVSAGSDANGQLGKGASSANVVINANIVPMLMPDGSNVYARAISAGGYHSAVLLNNGSACLCGKNDQGQCGASPTLVPQANSLGIISTLSNVVDVACGHEHTLFTRYDGQVMGFGRNDRGQLGKGNKTSPVTSVVQVLAGGGAGSSNGLSVEIAAGFNHSAYIKNDNTIFVFGANDKGQLGLGQTTTESLTPTQLVGYAGYDIACGRNHTVISTTPDPLTFNYTGNNALIAFGDNAYGQSGKDEGMLRGSSA
eukprot:gene4488-biopygen22199